MKLNSLTLFFPAYNDSKSIGVLVSRAFSIASELASDFEIIVVNDGSEDDTPKVLEALCLQFPQLVVVHHKKNQGYGAALRSGFSRASKEWIFYTDGDGQYDVSELKSLVNHLGPAVGWVNGFKISRSDAWYRIWIGKFYQAFVKAVFGLKIRDPDCDFRLVRRSLMDSFSLSQNGGGICVELVWKLQKTGCGRVEVPVHHYPRISGQSQFFRPKHLSSIFIQLPLLWLALFVPLRANRGNC